MAKSFRGKEVNIDLLRENNSKTLAVGNMRVNGRGDLIGRAGKILKTREQLENEYVKNNPMPLNNGLKIPLVLIGLSLTIETMFLR